MQTDQTRIESFLDDGWLVIGQLHQWLLQRPVASQDQTALEPLIRGLQTIWANADDLGLKGLARVSLAVEQVLERQCAGNLELDTQRRRDLTSGVGCLQDLLLGYEATREEQQIVDLETLSRLERYSAQPLWVDASPMHVVQTVVPLPLKTDVEEELVPEGFVHELINPELLVMLEQFVEKLDDTSHRLHARMLADEAPYTTTTSRLEHLAQATRDVVWQIRRPQQVTRAFVLESPLQSAEMPLANDDSSLSDVSETQMSVAESLIVSGETASFDVEHPIAEEVELREELFLADFSSSQFPSELKETEHSESTVFESGLKSRQILIVEESLFYRHLISMAVQSAGYDPHTAESVGVGMDLLKRSQEFGVIVVGSDISSSPLQSIESYRSDNGTKVVQLTSSKSNRAALPCADYCIEKSHPQKLLAILDTLFNGPESDVRKSA